MLFNTIVLFIVGVNFGIFGHVQSHSLRFTRDVEKQSSYNNSGEWYTVAEINPQHGISDISCARKNISESPDGQSITIRETYKSNGKDFEKTFVLTEDSVAPEKAMNNINVTYYNDNQEVIFQEKMGGNDMYLLQSRAPSASDATMNKMKMIAAGIDAQVIIISQNNCN